MFENKILRATYGPNLANGECRKRKIKELGELFIEGYIAEAISRRLKWEGHVNRKDKKLLRKGYEMNGNTNGKTPEERPRMSLEDMVHKDMQNL
ncbi:hypothetical protein J437_LFUL004904 [Ladona fulva]|uniref:Uncharacterized protein n=1 Tax=Ladona fulva TaxID=123851 RepID=A0A8K0JY05_LADFU|nr:hypothetical protein J437_LFUL004904 [Ladona fulva]